MKKLLTTSIVSLSLIVTTGAAMIVPKAGAQECEITQWRWARFTDDNLEIEGATTGCTPGARMDYQLWAGEELIGTDSTYLDALGGFETYFQDYGRVRPGTSLTIRYAMR
ncbi:MAG: hypothetical protein F4234_11530 [Gammaproteobacteria bacterium]|nr:hypothetical protein [Gammaproteobacteria bacterium]